ncbi:MAG: CvpA family protein [Pedosphaera sp.]|nr:CvpA family protein [Pedosphaera sp.]
MKLDSLPINWFDLLLLVWLGMGIFRGRKRGMSAELLTFLQWVAIVIASSILYAPIGNWLWQSSKVFGLLFSYIVGYAVTAGLVAIIFVLGKRQFGGKLVGSDAFGKWEYYLGIPAGLLRFTCMMIAILALLNARFYSEKEIKAERKYQMDNFDSEFFPTFQAVQAGVFEKSFTGPYIKKYLGFLLIKPTAPGTGEKPYKQKEWSAP